MNVQRLGCARNRISRGLAAATLFALAGCAGREPRASISDPAVFTAIHLRAAQTSLAAQSAQSGSTIGDMDRYLRTPEGDYQSKRLRMDAMLDTNQRSRAVAQAVLSRVSVELELLAKSIEIGGADDDKGEGDKPEDESDADKEADTSDEGDTDRKTDHTAELKEAIKELNTKINDLAKLATADAADSPFDTVDRAQDFYTTVLHKSLRNFGVDSHVVPPAETYAILQASEQLDAARGTLRVAEAHLNTALERARAKEVPARIGAMAELQAAYKQATGSELPKVPEVDGSTAKRDNMSTKSAGPAPTALVAASVPVGGTTLDAITLRPLENIDDEYDEPTPVEINESARKAEEARKAAAEAEEKASKAKKEAADAEAKAAIEQSKKAQLDLLSKELSLKTDAQDHAQQLEWYANIREAGEKIDKVPEESPEVKAARGAVMAAANQVRIETDNYNCAVANARYGLSGGSPAAFVAHGDVLKSGRRLVVLLLQAHVDRGLAPNHMVGLRATITGAKAGTADVSKGDIRVVRLHPTRNYDREDALFAEQLSEQLLLSAAGKFSSNINGSAARQLATESAEKQKFLSRIPKVASWADAARHEFGWDFYPNNLSIKRRGPLARSAGLIYGPAARNFEVLAHLDPGARDCAVYAIVPCNVTSITLELQTITAHISDPWDSARRVVDKSGSVTVPLPPFHPAEWQSGLGVPASDSAGGFVINPIPTPR